jgi:hypothetical protein
MTVRQIPEQWHLSLSIGKSLWDDLMGSALPFRIQEGSFDLGRAVYRGIKQLQLKETVKTQVTALLEDREPPQQLVQAKDRAKDLWRSRRDQVFRAIDDVLHVEGDWSLDLDEEGTAFDYAPQKIGVDAHVKAVASGRIHLLRKNVEIPFTLEKRIGARCALGDIHFDKNEKAITGRIQDPALDFGQHVAFRVLNELSAVLLANQAAQRFPTVPILKKAQVEEMVSPAGGPLRLQMGVEDVALEVTEENLTLKVRFGFSTKQLEG